LKIYFDKKTTNNKFQSSQQQKAFTPYAVTIYLLCSDIFLFIQLLELCRKSGKVKNFKKRGYCCLRDARSESMPLQKDLSSSKAAMK